MKNVLIFGLAVVLLASAAVVFRSGASIEIRQEIHERESAPATDPLDQIDGLKEIMTEDSIDSPPAEGGTIVLTLGGEPNTLNPLFMSSTAEFTLSSLLYEGGVDYDFNQAVLPNIYVGWDHPKDDPERAYRDFIISLDSNFVWSDGAPITAHDFKFAYDTILRDDVMARLYEDDMLAIEKLEILNDHQFNLVFKEAKATWYADISIPLIPKHIYEHEEDIQTSDYNRNPVVSGPYKIDKWNTQQEIRLVRNENYRGNVRPYADRLIFKIIPDTSVSMNAFLAEEIDYTIMSAEDLVTKATEQNFRDIGKIKMRSTPGFTYIGWNLQNPESPFYDLDVRVAMAHAIDRKKLQRYIYYNLRELSNGIFHPDQWFSNPDVEMIPYDLAEANRLLTKAGWVDTNNDGIRDKDGREFVYTMLIPQSEAATRISQAIQHGFSLVGVKMKIRRLEWATFIDMVRDGKFESYMAGWGGGFFPQTSKNIWHSSMANGQGRNYVGFNNPRVDALLDRGEVEFDLAEQKKIYQEIQQIVYDEQPYCFLFFSNSIIAHNRKIRGVRMSLYGPFRFSPGLLDWWVPPTMQRP